MRRRFFWPLCILGDFLVLLISPADQPTSYYVLTGLAVGAIAWALTED